MWVAMLYTLREFIGPVYSPMGMFPGMVTTLSGDVAEHVTSRKIREPCGSVRVP